MLAVNLGAAGAKLLFPVVGAYGVTALRITIGAAILVAARRPWRSPVRGPLVVPLVTYGVTLGMMNLLIYQAFARIPIGIALGIEVTGPLAIALLGSRRLRDLVWFAMAAVGLVLLLPLSADASLDPLGIAFACGAATSWALYIIAGKRVAHTVGRDAAAWGMLVAATFTLPVGMMAAGSALAAPRVLGIGLAVAVMSSAIPFTLEIEALRRLPAHVFSLLLSATPAVGALAGFFVLDEHLSAVQWLAIGCIVAATTGASRSAA